MELRPYQIEGLNGIRAAMSASGGRLERIILYSPTGSGKTEMGMSIVRAAVDKGKRVMFACNRINLVSQTSRRFQRAGISHGIIQGQNTTRAWEPVVVASIQTLASRGFPDNIDLLIIDEAHGAVAPAYRRLIESAKVPVVGLSATPFSKGLGKHYPEIGGALFQTIVPAATIRELIRMKFLVDVDIYAPSEPDLNGVKITAGDYNEAMLGDRVDRKELVGDIVEQWLKLANRVRTVCFATNIAHSKHIVSQFVAAGVRAEHIDCFTPEEERQRILWALDAHDIDVVSNVSVLAEGWDCPAVECMILARPTRSLIRYIQMAGRVLRPATGKTKALMLDHSGSCARLGFPTDDLPLELDDGNRPKPSAEEEKAQAERLPKPCPQCKFMIPVGVYKCPACGHEHKRKSDVVHIKGELVKLKRATQEEKQSWYSQLVGYARKKGYKDGWIANKYKEQFGVWPKNLHNTVAPMSNELHNKLLSSAIAYRKVQEREAKKRKDFAALARQEPLNV
jgi:superfamily II DNA or RNA helicase